MSDHTHIRTAIALAERGLGGTWPNPSVGCVIVSEAGYVVGRGRTGLRGRPHAETQALAAAGAAARGGTAYVSLEPCSHHGQTPPCADALAEAGIARAVVAAQDPDPRVNGQGLARLRAAGIEVVTGVLEREARATLAGFLSRVTLGRPWVTLKLATTLDGRIATRTGESQWITGPESRRAVHALRGRHDAVMVGVGTVAADDPELTCRLPGYAHRPTVRVVADGRLRTSPDTKLVRTAQTSPTWLLYHTDSIPDDVTLYGAPPGDLVPSRAQRLAEAGARCILVPEGEGGVDLHAALQALGTRGLTRVLVEGGAQLASALLSADLADEVVWFHASAAIGGDGRPALERLGVEMLTDMRRFTRLAAPTALGCDVMTIFGRA